MEEDQASVLLGFSQPGLQYLFGVGQLIFAGDLFWGRLLSGQLAPCPCHEEE
jgi:hypothetical protein